MKSNTILKNSILPLSKEHAEKLVSSFYSFAMERAMNSVMNCNVQFFRFKPNTAIPVGLGSGVLVKKDKDHYILTCAHVIDDRDKIFINLKGAKSISIQFPYLTTNVPESGMRADDNMDIGYFLLRNSDVDELKNDGLRFLDYSMIMPNYGQDVKDKILVAGFPASALKLGNKTMEQRIFAYPSPPVIITKTNQTNSEKHLIVPYERKTLKTLHSDNRVIGPLPNGMSGCGMWLLKEIKRGIFSPRLVGIFNEYDRNRSYLIGTKIDYYIDAIDEYYYRMKELLSKA